MEKDTYIKQKVSAESRGATYQFLRLPICACPVISRVLHSAPSIIRVLLSDIAHEHVGFGVPAAEISAGELQHCWRGRSGRDGEDVFLRDVALGAVGGAGWG